MLEDARRPRLVRLLGGPLGMRQHDVPSRAAGGYRIVVFRNGVGGELSSPVVYELAGAEHPKHGEVAAYAGLASEADVERWRAG